VAKLDAGETSEQFSYHGHTLTIKIEGEILERFVVDEHSKHGNHFVVEAADKSEL
jgi:hypothetical protein